MLIDFDLTVGKSDVIVSFEVDIERQGSSLSALIVDCFVDDKLVSKEARDLFVKIIGEGDIIDRAATNYFNQEVGA